MSIPLDEDFDPEATVAVTAPGEVVNGSPDSLHVAGTVWVNTDPYSEYLEGGPRHLPQGVIHSFDITEAGRAVYAATGHVPGQIAGQFSLAELDGHLRVATTGSGPSASTSQVRVLRRSHGRIVEVGSSDVIGQDELPDAVLIAGDAGYVAGSLGGRDSSEDDPFYSIDLSDRAHPVVIRSPASDSPARVVEPAVYRPSQQSTALRAAYDIQPKALLLQLSASTWRRARARCQECR